MTKRSYEKIAEGLREALAMAMPLVDTRESVREMAGVFARRGHAGGASINGVVYGEVSAMLLRLWDRVEGAEARIAAETAECDKALRERDALTFELNNLRAALQDARKAALREAQRICDKHARIAAVGGPHSCTSIDGALWYGREQYARACANEIGALMVDAPPCDTEAFLLRMLTAAMNGERVTAEDVAQLRRLADWADAPPPPTWNGTLDKGETARAVAAARKRMESKV